MQISSVPGSGVAALAVTAGTMLLASVHPDCAVAVHTTGFNPVFHQVQLRVSVRPAACAPGKRAVVRFRTAGGGVLPASGLILQPSYPNQATFWLYRGRPGHAGPSVEQLVGGQWKTVWRSGI